MWAVGGAEKLTLVLRQVAALSPPLRLSVLSPSPFAYELLEGKDHVSFIFVSPYPSSNSFPLLL